MKLTRKQWIFLLVYPWAHLSLVIVSLFMVMANGLGPPDAGELSPTPLQNSLSTVGAILFVFLCPVILLQTLGIPVHRLPAFAEYGLMFCVGVLYGLCIVFSYKKLTGS